MKLMTIDLSFDTVDTMKIVISASNFVRELSGLHPHLRHLVIILKRLLGFYDLNRPETGGINSYSLVTMVAGLLSSHNFERLDQAFIGFLNYYGSRFNPFTMGVKSKGVFFLTAE